MFTYHGAATLPHRTRILSAIPETCMPVSYRMLLPKCAVDAKGVYSSRRDTRTDTLTMSDAPGNEPTTVEPWPQESWRVLDWVESDSIASQVPLSLHSCTAALSNPSRTYSCRMRQSTTRAGTQVPSCRPKKVSTSGLVCATGTSDAHFALAAKWYTERAIEVDNRAGQLDAALALIDIACADGIPVAR